MKEAIEESINIKYKYSLFFMLFYKQHLEKDKLENSEDKILKDSIKDYIVTFKDIIEKLESKKALYEITNIESIINETLNPDFEWDKEINFINQEFAFLLKNDYIVNNLKNDFIFFIEQFKFVELIQGIIGFIEMNYRVNKDKETTCYKCLKTIYKTIIENKLNEENINEFINLLKTNEYFINNEKNILIKFYQTLLSKKESLPFLQKIKDSVTYQEENSFFDYSIEIKGLVDVYSLFINLLKNEEIKNDEEFINIYSKELEKNINLQNNINNFINKYFDFVKNANKNIQEDNKNETIIDNNINNINSNTFIIQFGYNSNIISIHGNLNEKFSDIIIRFISKTQVDKNSIYFLYNGNILNEEYILSEIVKRDDKDRNQMNN